jgi:hypothetical protein
MRMSASPSKRAAVTVRKGRNRCTVCDRARKEQQVRSEVISKSELFRNSVCEPDICCDSESPLDLRFAVQTREARQVPRSCGRTRGKSVTVHRQLQAEQSSEGDASNVRTEDRFGTVTKSPAICERRGNKSDFCSDLATRCAGHGAYIAELMRHLM